jgi:hypothetical protein
MNASVTTASRKSAVKNTVYTIPTNNALLGHSTDALITLGKTGQKEAAQAGLELLRRKTKRADLKRSAA